jgi:hypothetical protein
MHVSGGAYRIEYSRFILAAMFQRAPARRFYLVVLAVVLGALAAAGGYLRYRAIKAAEAATCETPAPPPKPATPPPALPGFELEAGCGPAPARPAPGKQ